MKSTEGLTNVVKSCARLRSIRTRRPLRSLPVLQHFLMKAVGNFYVSNWIYHFVIKVNFLGIFGSGIRKEKHLAYHTETASVL